MKQKPKKGGEQNEGEFADNGKIFVLDAVGGILVFSWLLLDHSRPHSSL